MVGVAGLVLLAVAADPMAVAGAGTAVLLPCTVAEVAAEATVVLRVGTCLVVEATVVVIAAVVAVATILTDHSARSCLLTPSSTTMSYCHVCCFLRVA